MEQDPTKLPGQFIDSPPERLYVRDPLAGARNGLEHKIYRTDKRCIFPA